mgnify:CR=1 FL=1
MTPRDWRVDDLGGRLRIEGVLEISNPHPRMEVFVPELRVEPVLLGSSDPTGLEVKTRIIADHPDEETRADGYWAAYIVKGLKTTRARVLIEITGPTPPARVDSLWVDAHWANYGPFGRLQRRQGVLVPLTRPEPLQPDQVHFRQGEGCRVLALRTHLLGPLDNAIDVLRTYAADLVQPGDILTIGETPVAVIQGRYRHPSEVKPGMVARLACRVFHPTSSLATACGMQTLIDLVGPTRVLAAWLGGLLMKIVGIPGGFYRLAGEQAREPLAQPDVGDQVELGPHADDAALHLLLDADEGGAQARLAEAEALEGEAVGARDELLLRPAELAQVRVVEAEPRLVAAAERDVGEAAEGAGEALGERRRGGGRERRPLLHREVGELREEEGLEVVEEEEAAARLPRARGEHVEV